MASSFENAAAMMRGGGYMPQGFQMPAPAIKIPGVTQMNTGLADSALTVPTQMGAPMKYDQTYGPYGIRDAFDWSWGGQQTVESDLALRNAMQQLQAQQAHDTWRTQYDAAQQTQEAQKNRDFQKAAQVSDEKNQSYEKALDYMYQYGMSPQGNY